MEQLVINRPIFERMSALADSAITSSDFSVIQLTNSSISIFQEIHYLILNQIDTAITTRIFRPFRFGFFFLLLYSFPHQTQETCFVVRGF